MFIKSKKIIIGDSFRCDRTFSNFAIVKNLIVKAAASERSLNASWQTSTQFYEAVLLYDYCIHGYHLCPCLCVSSVFAVMVPLAQSVCLRLVI